jgi:hypothetical protein
MYYCRLRVRSPALVFVKQQSFPSLLTPNTRIHSFLNTSNCWDEFLSNNTCFQVLGLVLEHLRAFSPNNRHSQLFPTHSAPNHLFPAIQFFAIRTSFSNVISHIQLATTRFRALTHVYNKKRPFSTVIRCYNPFSKQPLPFSTSTTMPGHQENHKYLTALIWSYYCLVPYISLRKCLMVLLLFTIRIWQGP